ETSFRGQKLAARYLASQFELMGLQPEGDSGTYFQRFPVMHVTIDTRSFLTTSTPAGTKEWTGFGAEYVPYSSGRDTTISGEVEFVGYGINSKILLYSDYDPSKSYKGKIVLALRGAPSKDDSAIALAKNDAAVSGYAKRMYAENNGAAAILMVEDLKGRTMKDALGDHQDDLVRGIITIPQRLRARIPMFAISKNIANELLRSSGKNVDDLQRTIDSTEEPESFPIKDAKITLTVLLHKEEVFSENVIGVLPGSDSLLKNEYVAFSAHYDHLGKNIVTGEVYNGADDDGSGTCSLLEIAHAFTSMKQPPKRSLLFLSVSGEEKGLLGSLYYTEHPTIPLEETITDLNADMIGRFDPEHEQMHDTNYVYLIGSDKLSTELDSISRKANDESMKLNLDYTYDDEQDPHQYYRRSDHYNFAKKNIPIIFYFNGEHADYHKPTDKVEKINFGILTKRARLIFYTGWKLANIAFRPVVNMGGFTSPPSGKR
ncbi:MAG: M28 family peptidase, partial [Bacteroidota bacterium]